MGSAGVAPAVFGVSPKTLVRRTNAPIGAVFHARGTSRRDADWSGRDARAPLWQISSFPSPPPPIRMAVMKHKGKATQAALKLIFGTLVALLCVMFIGFASILLGSFLTGIGRFLFGLWMVFALFCLWFFRDPNPNVPSDPNVIVAPAHGKVDVIDETAEP